MISLKLLSPWVPGSLNDDDDADNAEDTDDDDEKDSVGPSGSLWFPLVPFGSLWFPLVPWVPALLGGGWTHELNTLSPQTPIWKKRTMTLSFGNKRTMTLSFGKKRGMTL